MTFRPLQRAAGGVLGAVAPPLTALLVVSAVAMGTTDRFATGRNLENVALQVSIVAIIAIGSTCVILTGGIDLSPGAMAALLTMLAATALTDWDVPMPVTVVGVVAVGGLLGALNGLITTFGRVPSFVATLGTMGVFQGCAFLFNHGSPIFNVSESIGDLFYGTFLHLPLPLYYVLILYGLAHLMLFHTVTGRSIYAVGGNEVAAALSGLSPRRTRFVAFVFAGLMAGVAAALMTARLNAGSPNYGVGLELQAITAAVVGGASLMGGVGNVAGTLAGALTIVVVQNTLNLNAVSTTWQNIALGAIIILAVSLDGWRAELTALLRRVTNRRAAGGGPAGPPGVLAPEPVRTAAEADEPLVGDQGGARMEPGR
jgi:ribose transport system permease protein